MKYKIRISKIYIFSSYYIKVKDIWINRTFFKIDDPPTDVKVDRSPPQYQ